MSFLSAIPLALVALYANLLAPALADGLCSCRLLAVMAGFLLATQPCLAADSSGAVDVALLNAGNGLFIMAAQMALITIATRNCPPSQR